MELCLILFTSCEQIASQFVFLVMYFTADIVSIIVSLEMPVYHF